MRQHAMKTFNFKKKKLKKKSYYQTNHRNHMKVQKFVIFVKKILKINMQKIKNIVKFEIIAII